MPWNLDAAYCANGKIPLCLASAMAKSEAVLPAYLIGMVLAPFFLKERVLAQRMRVIAFTLLTPFYFLKAGSLVKS